VSLLSEGDSDVQWHSALTLSMIGKPAVDSLILALKDKHWWVRTRSAWALGEIKDTRAVEPLIQSVNDQDWYVRWGAADALGKIGDNRALEPLTLLKDDDDDYVRRAGKEAIEKIRADNSNNTA